MAYSQPISFHGRNPLVSDRPISPQGPGAATPKAPPPPPAASPKTPLPGARDQFARAGAGPAGAVPRAAAVAAGPSVPMPKAKPNTIGISTGSGGACIGKLSALTTPSTPAPTQPQDARPDQKENQPDAETAAPKINALATPVEKSATPSVAAAVTPSADAEPKKVEACGGGSDAGNPRREGDGDGDDKRLAGIPAAGGRVNEDGTPKAVGPADEVDGPKGGHRLGKGPSGTDDPFKDVDADAADAATAAATTATDAGLAANGANQAFTNQAVAASAHKDARAIQPAAIGSDPANNQKERRDEWRKKVHATIKARQTLTGEKATGPARERQLVNHYKNLRAKKI